MSTEELVVYAADVPARFRAGIRLDGKDPYILQDALMKGLFVGDLVAFESDTGGLHQGVVYGAAGSLVKVLVENWTAYVGWERIVRLNGIEVRKP